MWPIRIQFSGKNKWILLLISYWHLTFWLEIWTLYRKCFCIICTMLSWNETHLSNVISNYTFNTSVYLKSKCNNCLNNRFGPQIETIIEIAYNFPTHLKCHFYHTLNSHKYLWTISFVSSIYWSTLMPVYTELITKFDTFSYLLEKCYSCHFILLFQWISISLPNYVRNLLIYCLG